MVATALPSVTSSEGLSQDEHHFEKPRWQPRPRYTSGFPQQKYYQGGENGKRIGQRGATKGSDHRWRDTPDVTGRVNLLSSACPSDRAKPNLKRFLDATTPRVKTETLPSSVVRQFKASFPDSVKRTCNPEETRHFNLGDLWDSFDECSAYGIGVPLMLDGDESVVQYYVPYLSALQLYRARQPRYHQAEEDKPGVWSYIETSPPNCRVPLVDKIADLSADFEQLRSLKSYEILPNSWFSVAWYPIYRIPTGPTLRDLAACFLTFHSLSTSLPAGDGPDRQCSAERSSDVQELRPFGLASYKMRGPVWSSDSEKRLAARLENSAYEHLTNVGVDHSDFNFFAASVRR